MVSSAPDAIPEPSRVERKRRERERRFVEAAKRIVADEGFEALTLPRLAAELDMAVSAVYRYFPSKGALVRQVQVEAIENLSRSLGEIRTTARGRFAEAEDDPATVALAPLVLVGRWLCAAAGAFPEDVRLLQMIMAQRTSNLDEDGGELVVPVAFDLVLMASAAVEEAADAGVITPADPLDRALIWASALSGVLQTDDLERYAPDRFGGTRLAQQANLDLILGWGADPAALARANGLVDDLAAGGPLAP